MRKKNLAVVGQYQMPPSMPAHATQAPAVSIAGATDTHQIQATNQAAMAAQGESILASSHAKMEAVVGPPPSNLTAEAAEAPVANNQHKTNDGSWTCDKCTCDNLASETRCKICEALKPGTKQSTV